MIYEIILFLVMSRITRNNSKSEHKNVVANYPSNPKKFKYKRKLDTTTNKINNNNISFGRRIL